MPPFAVVLKVPKVPGVLMVLVPGVLMVLAGPAPPAPRHDDRYIPFRYLSYQPTIRASKSSVSATLFGGRWAPVA